MLLLGAAVGWNLFWDRLLSLSFVPGVSFERSAVGAAPDFARPEGWLSRPDLPQDPARWLPDGMARTANPQVAVFYVSPTTFLGRDRWNAPLTDNEANERLRLFASSQASAFNAVGAIWAPRYRQATIGAFLSDGADAQKALDFAYQDIARGFDAFLAQIPRNRPIVLAGHSQGSLHLMRLLQEKVAGKPVADRIVAAYLPGWPISITADLPALGLPGCAAPGQAGCILSWQAFADGGDPRLLTKHFDTTTGLTGAPRKGTAMLCVNPLTGAPGTAALATANKGALVPRTGLHGADLVPAKVPARCDPRGLLLIGDAPAGYGAYVLPGGNFHVFDYALFWANLRADVEARAKTYLGKAWTPLHP